MEYIAHELVPGLGVAWRGESLIPLDTRRLAPKRNGDAAFQCSTLRVATCMSVPPFEFWVKRASIGLVGSDFVRSPKNPRAIAAETTIAAMEIFLFSPGWRAESGSCR